MYHIITPFTFSEMHHWDEICKMFVYRHTEKIEYVEN